MKSELSSIKNNTMKAAAGETATTKIQKSLQTTAIVKQYGDKTVHHRTTTPGGLACCFFETTHRL
jgi:hypothetical protein